MLFGLLVYLMIDFLYHLILFLSASDYCEPYQNCTWKEAILMSRSIIIDVSSIQHNKEKWFIYAENRQYIFLKFNEFDIGCQSGSILTLVLSLRETLHLCNQNKPVFGLKSSGKLLTISFTYQMMAERLVEGFGAAYTKHNNFDTSEGLISEEETGKIIPYKP